MFEAVVHHAALLREAGAKVCVFALADEFADKDRDRLGGCEFVTAPVLGPGQVGYAPKLVDALLEADLDLLHLHGIWMYPSAAGATWARRTGRPYIISAHGMLDPWITSRGRWKKALARAGYERRSWRAASAFHALTGREAKDIAAEAGAVTSVVIPNPGPQVTDTPAQDRAPCFGYIGRIHPKKNLMALIDAWQMLGDARRLPDGAMLTLAGWGEDGDVEALNLRLETAPDSIRFVGPVFGGEKDALLSTSRFMVLPSLSEGLPVAALEAWAAGTPMLMSEECNLPEGFEAGAAIDCGMTAATIADAIVKALDMTGAQWNEMSRAATALASGPFGAPAVSRRWCGLIGTLVAQGGGKA
ncbi:glycosyltransferase [Croceicoccus sediminis]|uniref:glycosyltransferase n=1 Tax=Croceicoccus sediminis TaxID=2571150 RepID=UPI0011841D43|nr:glycosyltransferase [Croceicoccus sediminis]